MRVRTCLLFVILALPFFVALHDSSIWDTNEAYYSQIPREMVASGDWLVPTFNGKPFLIKPPLTHWIVGSLYKLFGVDLFWERLTGALLSLGAIIAVFFIGRILFNSGIGVLGAALFATSPRLQLISRRILIDGLLIFCSLMAVLFFLLWLKKKHPAWLLLSSFFLGLGFLAKGPVILLTVLFLGLYYFLTGAHRTHFPLRWILIAGGLFMIVSCGWFGILAISNELEGIRTFFLKENIGRYISVHYGPRRGLFYYFGVFLVDFFPWSCFLPAAIYGFARLWKRSELEESDRHALILLGLWFATYFVLFSFSYNKQEYYILPAYPAAALCLAAFFKDRKDGVFARWLVASLLAISGGVVWFVTSRIFPDTGGLWLPPALMLLAAVLILRWRLIWVPVTLALFYAAAFSLYLEPFERYMPVRAFAETIQKQVEQRAISGDFIPGYYRLAAPSLRFYLNRNILELIDLEKTVAVLESTTPAFLITDSQGYQELKARMGDRVGVVEERPILDATGRNFIGGLLSETVGSGNPWVQDVYLITNK